MPLYNYICADHGEFDAWCSMSQASDPADCPDCQSPSPRAISTPSLAMMNAATRKAHHVNERSADQPQVVTKGAKESSSHGAACRHGHGHGHGRGRSHGHSHGPSRPWMIGH